MTVTGGKGEGEKAAGDQPCVWLLAIETAINRYMTYTCDQQTSDSM